MRDEPRKDWLVGEQFTVVRVDSLPYAHNPYKCDHFPLFEPEGAARDDSAGRCFFASLGARKRAMCTYHRLADWRRVADASVHLHDAFRHRSCSELFSGIEEERLPSGDLEQLWLLFSEPIVWGGETARITDGQHRTCAIRSSGATLVVVDDNRFRPYDS